MLLHYIFIHQSTTMLKLFYILSQLFCTLSINNRERTGFFFIQILSWMILCFLGILILIFILFFLTRKSNNISLKITFFNLKHEIKWNYISIFWFFVYNIGNEKKKTMTKHRPPSPSPPQKKPLRYHTKFSILFLVSMKYLSTIEYEKHKITINISTVNDCMITYFLSLH